MLNLIQYMMIDEMDKVDFGDIVLLKFPFTDGQQFKK